MSHIRFYSSACLIGESPVWHQGRKCFFWVDIEGKKLYQMSWPGGKVKMFAMPHRIGMTVVNEDGNLIVALQNELAKFNLETKQTEWLIDFEKEIRSNRPNDGKCDSEGRLWLGTMHVDASENSGSLYCIQKNEVSKRLSSLTISNGMVWSLNNQRFYFIDSALKQIDAYLFTAGTGAIVFEKTIIRVPEKMGLPDGMTIDSEGMLWVAHWGGFCVARWNPENGELLCRINLPVPQVSSCAWGGKHLDQLFITTARIGLCKKQLENYPQSGHVFIVQPGIKGVAANHCKNLI